MGMVCVTNGPVGDFSKGVVWGVGVWFLIEFFEGGEEAFGRFGEVVVSLIFGSFLNDLLDAYCGGCIRLFVA